jgi:hypothetical protein
VTFVHTWQEKNNWKLLSVRDIRVPYILTDSVRTEKKKKKKKMTDWLHSVRTDGLPYIHCIALHCIALHCIALYCIVLHLLYCIALHCIAYWLNVMLIVRHVCSWIVPSVTFNVLPPIGSVFVFVYFFFFFFFFWLGPPYGRTDLLDCMRLNWNWTEITETCLSIRDIFRTYWQEKNLKLVCPSVTFSVPCTYWRTSVRFD